MNKNVLYLSYDGMTDPLGQSQVIPYLEGLSKTGYSFTLISFEKPERFSKFSNTIDKRLKEANIEWAPLSYTKKPSVLSTIWDVLRMRKNAFELQKQKKFNIVHCRSYISALVGLQMKKKYGVKFVFDMRGFYADERVEGGLWNLTNPVYKAVYNFFKKKELEFFSVADYTISLTENGKREIQSWKTIPNQPIPIKVIPCCADLDKFSAHGIDQKARMELKAQLGIKDNEYVLSYLGSIGTWYMPDEMLDFYNALLQQKPEARFLFITNEPKELILDIAKKKNIPAGGFIFTSVPHHLVPLYLSVSNASIFFIKPVFSKKASSPTKQGEIMGMGLPQVCNGNVGDVDEITDDKSGALIKQFNGKEYERAVSQLLQTIYDASYIRSRAEKYYSLKEGVKRYKQVYEMC